MNRLSLGTALIALLVVAGASVPAMAMGPGAAPAAGAGPFGAVAATAAQQQSQQSTNVSVAVGSQLATVLAVSSDDVHAEVDDVAFELEVEDGDDEARARAVADRADELRERAADIRADYEAATAAYEAGEISADEYAQRLASLNARATTLLQSAERLDDRAADVSRLELEAAGANLSGLDAALADLDTVTGAGSSALLEQFLGEADGHIRLETADGVRIEVEREDGESSREFERPRDADMNITVSHADALAAASAALSPPAEGHWTLVESKVKPLEGAYEFRFALAGAPALEGEAKVRVDGSTGEVYRLEQEVEAEDDEADDDGDDGDDADDDDDRDDLAVLVAEGSPAPNATIVVQVLAGGEPVSNATVAIDDHVVGTTDADGRLTVTLPDADEVEIEARHDDADGELEFEFGDDHHRAAVYERLDVAATLDGDTVSVAVRFDGEPVSNATVYADDERVGVTDAAGEVSFAFDAVEHDELELEVVKGAFEAELEYAVVDGALVLTEAEHEGDGDKADDGHDADDHDDDADEHDDDADDHDDDADEHDGDDADDHEADVELVLAVIHGTAGPGETVTLEVRADGAPVEGATVSANGEVLGTTGADGTLAVTLPVADDVDLRAEYGDADTRLEFEFDGVDDDRTTSDDEPESETPDDEEA